MAREKATLGDALSKLARASEHIEVIREKDRSLSGSGRPYIYPLVVKRHREGLEYRFHVGEIPPFDPAFFALRTGDCLFNLRATLDHIVYALHVNRRARMTDYIAKSSQFPILTGQAFTKKGRRTRDTSTWPEIRNLNARQRKAIEILQPYYRRNQNLADLRESLWEIQSLNNVDKHRHLHVTRHAVVAVPIPRFAPEYGFRSELVSRTFESQTEVLRWTFAVEPPDIARQVQMNDHVAGQVTLDEGREQIELVPLLEHLLNAVTRVFVRFSERFF